MRPSVPSALLLGVAALVGGCDRSPPPGARPAASGSARASVAAPVAGDPTLPEELTPSSPAASAEAPDAGAAEPPPHPGPWLVVTAPAAAVYPRPEFVREEKLGYVRNGGRVPVREKPVSTKSCSSGWYEIVGGGYLCGNLGTTDLEHPQVKFALKQPDLDDVLPYAYARNAKNGTPLYRSVPSREQMNQYEPYLASAKKAKQEREKEEAKRDDGDTKSAKEIESASVTVDGGAPDRERVAQALTDAGVLGLDPTQPEEPKKPWWQREDAKDKLHEVTLEELESEGDDILAKRMVTGFYIAVDKTFRWNDRLWHKSTKGLVAPADRFWLTPGSKFKGVDLDGTKWRLPVAWVYGGRKSAPTYTIDEGSSSPKPAKSVESFTAIQLTGREQEVGGTRYSETSDGTWIKQAHVRITKPGPPPKDLRPNERWIDVNLSSQTLVVFEGARAIYATLTSSGKQSTIKEKDHRTPTGQWRVREKHVTTTMDGNGSAAGDLPYSIEDVPYVMYFHQSYAVHGAFWHRNFGIQMSHGCLNLAPLDAKRVFFLADPPLPQGWHGAWSSKAQPGSWVVVHE